MTGSLDAGDRGEALRQLGRKGLQPVSMSENAEGKVSPKKDSGKSALVAAGVAKIKEEYNIGDFVNVKINDCTSATLIGKGIGYSKNN